MIVFLVFSIGLIFVFREHSKRLGSALEERDEARNQRDYLTSQLEEARVKIAKYESAQEERERVREQSRQDLDTHFEGIASRVLRANSAELRKQAEEQLRQHRELADKDLEASKTAVAGLVEPMKENLERLRRHVVDFDKSHSTVAAEVKQGVEQLANQARDLRKILHNPQLRGQWGEQHLRNVLEAAGMTSRVDYLEQASVGKPDDPAQRRPDVLVHIPYGTKVVIDSKTPHERYDEAMRAEDEPARKTLLKRHAQALAGHARDLAKRGYAESIDGSLDFVVMYVPMEAMLEAAIRAEPDLWYDTWQRHRVLIATPGLLIAFLRTVALAWSRMEIQNNAEEISKAGQELCTRLGNYAKHVEKMGNGLRQAVNSYNDSVGSFESRLLVQARRFEELSASNNQNQIGGITRVEAAPRRLSAPESQAAS